MQYVHKVSVDYAFNLLSNYTGEEESLGSNNYLNNPKFKTLFQEMVKTHSMLLFAKEELEESKSSSSSWK